MAMIPDRGFFAAVILASLATTSAGLYAIAHRTPATINVFTARTYAAVADEHLFDGYAIRVCKSDDPC